MVPWAAESRARRQPRHRFQAMDEARQEKAVESLRDWCKWVIGLDFGAVVGCVFILENGQATLVITPFLVIASAFFAISIVCSVLLIRQLVQVAEDLPLRDSGGNLISLFQHKIGAGLSIGDLTTLQLVSLGAGGSFFMAWVVIRAVAGG
jgi:hypothetical protein